MRSGSATRWSSTHPFFIEDPLRSENPDSFKTLRPRTSVPLAAGEQFSSKWEFRQLIEEEWIDYARIDLCLAGGITEAKKIAGWCETHYIKIAVHNPLSPVSSAACLHLNLSCPNFAVQEQPRKTGTILTDVVPVQPIWEDGYLLAPTTPGLGIEFDREAAKAHPFRMTELPQVQTAGWIVYELVSKRGDGERGAWYYAGALGPRPRSPLAPRPSPLAPRFTPHTAPPDPTHPTLHPHRSSCR